MTRHRLPTQPLASTRNAGLRTVQDLRLPSEASPGTVVTVPRPLRWLQTTWSSLPTLPRHLPSFLLFATTSLAAPHPVQSAAYTVTVATIVEPHVAVRITTETTPAYDSQGLATFPDRLFYGRPWTCILAARRLRHLDDSSTLLGTGSNEIPREAPVLSPHEALPRPLSL
ncbi:hypothetical protein ARMGADRAFT_1093636 [Armillaria gallica]|uniref:Uncharacterized protein n=1 Tax=Armillaria gallica TaxID=47427 RepID=A0A2H3CS35_ARMGA|nr:hypothetical protein ARMGADRAFT_1093636 [Armillaria gallica]